MDTQSPRRLRGNARRKRAGGRDGRAAEATRKGCGAVADAPLFHATKPERLGQILRDDALKPTPEAHPIPRAFRRGGLPADWRRANVIFLTRSFEFARDWEPCVLVLNQRRLRQRTRVFPMDPLALRRSLDHHRSEETGAIAQRRWMVGRWDEEPIAFPWDEQVEAAEGTITPLTPVLLSIWVPDRTLDTLPPEDRALVTDHPAFRRTFPGSIHTRRFG
jgi:hypothetical protein